MLQAPLKRAKAVKSFSLARRTDLIDSVSYLRNRLSMFTHAYNRQTKGHTRHKPKQSNKNYANDPGQKYLATPCWGPPVLCQDLSKKWVITSCHFMRPCFQVPGTLEPAMSFRDFSPVTFLFLCLDPKRDLHFLIPSPSQKPNIQTRDVARGTLHAF